MKTLTLLSYLPIQDVIHWATRRNVAYLLFPNSKYGQKGITQFSYLSCISKRIVFHPCEDLIEEKKQNIENCLPTCHKDTSVYIDAVD